MKELQLIDRVVVEIRGEEGTSERMSLVHIANELRKVAEQIENGMKGDEWVEEDMRTHEHREVLFEHECTEFGFRMGDKSLIGMHYYGSEPKPRIIKDDEFVVCYLTKSDIEQQHFDPSGIDDDTMESIASRMNEYLCEGVGYWDALDAACEFYDIPRKEDEEP